jgi:hypothetical protein
MALATCDALQDVYGDAVWRAKSADAFKRVMKARWASSGLPADNPFTRSLVLRTAGVLVAHDVIDRDELLEIEHKQRAESRLYEKGAPFAEAASLRTIATRLASATPQSLEVPTQSGRGGSYPPAITLGYWLVDGTTKLEIELPQKSWANLKNWASKEFARQLSLIVSGHEALMDPVAMMMAGCTIAHIRSYAGEHPAFAETLLDGLPTAIELEAGIRELFRKQTPSGIWPKYFPLFHYPDGGANYTFSFELLEAVATEFPDAKVWTEESVALGVERALNWCETNRLEYRQGESTYFGWNSGGQSTTVERGAPESWATGTVHMFLRELDKALDSAIDGLAFKKYAPGLARRAAPSRRRWDGMVDTDLSIDGDSTTVRRLFEEQMINDLQGAASPNPQLPKRRSALLFGPPGTSKTSLVKAFADRIGWPFIELNPSQFLTNGLDGVYAKTDEIFRDLSEIKHVVVLFDELDALVKQRPSKPDEPPLDIAREFMTTTMLPKLAELHERKHSFYFMATNHRSFFDDAVIRHGRFDLHVFMGMPTWNRKLESLKAFLPPADKTAVTELRKVFRSWVPKKTERAKSLDLFSFGEMRTLLDQYRGKVPLSKRIKKTNAQKDFERLVDFHAASVITLRAKRGDKDNPVLQEYEKDKTQSRYQ